MNDWLPNAGSGDVRGNKKRRSRGGKKNNKSKSNHTAEGGEQPMEQPDSETTNNAPNDDGNDNPPGLYRGTGEDARWAIPEDEEDGAYKGIFASALQQNQWSSEQIQFTYALVGRQGLRDEMLASQCPVTAVTKAFKLCEENNVTKESAARFEDDFSVVQPLPGKVAQGA